MSFLTDKLFWIRSAERAVKTFAQVLVTILTSDAAFGFFDANWPEALGAAAFATLLSFLTSVASTQVGDSHSPSLVENKVEEAVVEKIESGEPVGDPERVVETDVLDQEFVESPRTRRKPRRKAQ